MRPVFIRRFVTASALVGAASILISAQAATPQDPQQQPPPPKFRTEANFVRVDAYPMKDGKPLLGLKAEDFEVFEDNSQQKIVTFEHVVIRPAGPGTERVEPSSQREMLQAAADPRTRVFVIFLDTPHVMIDSAHRINEPLIRLIDRILGPDDLVAVMTPDMAANQIVLGRKTLVIERSLRENWPWGQRFTNYRDPREEAYMACYPPLPKKEAGQRESDLAKEMIARKRERATLEALEDLVRYLRTIREERKAIVTVTEGWLLFGQNPEMMKLREDGLAGYKEPVPGVDPIGVGPNGKLTMKDPRNAMGGALTKTECDTDRMTLANMDNRRFFRDIMDEANYANASFYPIDPRGLPVFDNAIGPDAPPPVNVDRAMLTERIESLRTLAINTDGTAVVNNNDLDKGMRRIVDDLTAYYLLGYYSTNAKLDGRFRTLKVRVKQPGVDVRARRGYRAATAEEVNVARRAADTPIPAATAAVTAALDKLGRIRPDTRFRINAAAVGDSGKPATVWVAGELQSSGGRPDEFAQGATAEIEATAGGATATARVTLKAGERTFLTTLTLPNVTSPQLDVRTRLSSAEGGTPLMSEPVRLTIGPTAEQPLLFRRGATTGNRVLPAADFRFSRTERLRIEIPVGSDVKPGPGRVLDRAGQALQPPVTVGERVDETSGQRWITGDVTLAPLAGGDYAIEVETTGPGGTRRLLTPIRVTR
jgi:VWFA-related protein